RGWRSRPCSSPRPSRAPPSVTFTTASGSPGWAKTRKKFASVACVNLVGHELNSANTPRTRVIILTVVRQALLLVGLHRLTTRAALQLPAIAMDGLVSRMCRPLRSVYEDRV